MEIRLSAPSSPAILAAAVSALMLYTFPSPSHPTVDTTGMYPLSITSVIGATLTRVISPTKPSRSSFTLASIMWPSIPDRPIARPPLFSIRATRLLLILPASTICTMSAVSLSVTRSPSTNTLSFPIFLSISVISGPPPCTSTTLTPISDSRTMSRMTESFSSSLIMALPPYLITTTLPVYSWI